VKVWRLCKRRHAALDGEGARLAGGRWNSRGTTAIYASDSLSLAVLELLVHCDPALLPDDLVAIAIEIPDGLALRRIEIAELPRSWRRHPAPESLARIGDLWAKDVASAVLSVPSAVVPGERNVLFNPRHPDFVTIRAGRPERFALDARLAGRR
jgi:RES domain-containing protein